MKYFALAQEGNEASVTIYGDITSWEWKEGDVSSYTLSKRLEGIEADVINVYINSYGGEVAEGLAIYNALKRHKAKVRTFADGFAASIASVIFMAGCERVMSPASLLMIHNVWACTSGNAEELRKVADDLEKINEASVSAYLEHVTIPEGQLRWMMDRETWLTPKEALEMGFATHVSGPAGTTKASQKARQSLFDLVTARTGGANGAETVVVIKKAGVLTVLEPKEAKVQKFLRAICSGKEQDNDESRYGEKA